MLTNRYSEKCMLTNRNSETYMLTAQQKHVLLVFHFSHIFAQQNTYCWFFISHTCLRSKKRTASFSLFTHFCSAKMIEPRTRPERGERHSELNSAWISSWKNIAVPHIRGQKFQLDRRLVLHNAIPSWTPNVWSYTSLGTHTRATKRTQAHMWITRNRTAVAVRHHASRKRTTWQNWSEGQSTKSVQHRFWQISNVNTYSCAM